MELPTDPRFTLAVTVAAGALTVATFANSWHARRSAKRRGELAEAIAISTKTLIDEVVSIQRRLTEIRLQEGQYKNMTQDERAAAQATAHEELSLARTRITINEKNYKALATAF